jgi:hypothetical protein
MQALQLGAGVLGWCAGLLVAAVCVRAGGVVCLLCCSLRDPRRPFLAAEEVVLGAAAHTPLPVCEC